MKGSKPLRKQLNVQAIELQPYTFILNENELNEQVTASKQVIVDSDDFAFIYLLDSGEGYYYLRIQPELWGMLAQGIIQQKDPVAISGENTLTLTQFNEELEALLFNIEGNGNYGEAFVEEVERVFAAILQA
ncbi:UPF0738 family protein [Lysinibacillus alkalisoli]|uniref:UPF0738 family protein n=1 Tax=Lysinibacillus alkalisoli TaxID=1911548 RepID=UPI001E57A03A|nr:hypothetical protein [Lysinibacillus alkalisoli]